MSRPDRPDMATALLPQELLALAIDHEREEMHRYRHLAFLFLPFGRGISPLMATLGIECEERLTEMHRVARENGLSLPCVDSSGRAPPASGESFDLINNRGQALATLRRTEVRAEHAVRVAEHLQKINVTPALQSLLPGQMAQKQAECHILRELIAAYDGEFTEDTRLASHPWPRGWLAGARQLH